MVRSALPRLHKTYQKAYLGQYEGTFEGSFTKQYEGNFIGQYTKTYLGQYTGTFEGAFNKGYEGTFNKQYEGQFAGSRTFSGQYGKNYQKLEFPLHKMLYPISLILCSRPTLFSGYLGEVFAVEACELKLLPKNNNFTPSISKQPSSSLQSLSAT